MMGLAATAFLITLAAAAPTVTPIDTTRFRVAIVYEDGTPKGHAAAQVAVLQAAGKHCEGKGAAVSEGALELNRGEKKKRGKTALTLSEVYSCKARK